MAWFPRKTPEYQETWTLGISSSSLCRFIPGRSYLLDIFNDRQHWYFIIWYGILTQLRSVLSSYACTIALGIWIFNHNLLRHSWKLMDNYVRRIRVLSCSNCSWTFYCNKHILLKYFIFMKSLLSHYFVLLNQKEESGKSTHQLQYDVDLTWMISV